MPSPPNQIKHRQARVTSPPTNCNSGFWESCDVPRGDHRTRVLNPQEPPKPHQPHPLPYTHPLQKHTHAHSQPKGG